MGVLFLFRGDVVDVVLELLVLLGFGSSVVLVEVFILEEWFSMFCVWRLMSTARPAARVS